MMRLQKNEGIPARVQGIPCLVEVTTYQYISPWKGSVYTCPSDVDWYGDECIEFDVYDRKGYPAPWLKKKLTDTDQENIEEIIRRRLRY